MRLRMLAAVMLAAAPVAGLHAQQQPPPADPLTVTVQDEDVQRFVKLWKKTSGHPTAAEIDADYIRPGSIGLRIFTPHRIIDGANMAKQIAAHHDWYEQALGKCLPWIAEHNADLRSIYLGLRGLLPEKPLPQIYMVIGGANSGGTAAPGAQVLGLEILCRDGPTSEAFTRGIRTFFAHETTHTFQGGDKDASLPGTEPLLTQILAEGGADYVASLVTGASASSARDGYGFAHEREIWSQFVVDRVVSNRDYRPAEHALGKAGHQAFAHWLYNAGAGKLPGWETDMGYWLGMQIAKAYVEHAADPHAAVREVLAMQDPTEILRKSGYGERFTR